MGKKNLFLVLHIICFAVNVVSLFFPFLIKLKVSASNLDLPGVEYGYDFFFTALSITLSANILYFSIISEKKIILLIFSLFNLLSVYFLRLSIHFQGFIDHAYDSKTGLGYHLLFLFSILQFIVILVENLRSKFGKHKARIK